MTKIGDSGMTNELFVGADASLCKLAVDMGGESG